MSIPTRILSTAIAVMVLIPAAAQAQMSPASFGIKAGINSASLSMSTEDPEDEIDFNRLLGGIGGVFVGVDVNRNFGLQVEGLYSMRGAKFDDFGDNKLKLNYIDVPVLARFGGESMNGARFFAFTGPQASFNIKAESEFLDETEDIKDDIENFDFGWVIGAGMEYSRFTLDARYTHGLMNIATEATGDEWLKNRTFSVMVGVRLK